MSRINVTGAELAAMRHALGLSQTPLGERVGIGRHAVSYWETKVEVDRYAWAVCQMAEVLPLPPLPPIRVYMPPPHPLMASFAAQEAQFLAKVAGIKARAEAWKAKQRVICGAKTRKGTRCRMKSEPGKRRCKFHRGMSTGARTPEGKARIAEATRARWARWRAAQRQGDTPPVTAGIGGHRMPAPDPHGVSIEAAGGGRWAVLVDMFLVSGRTQRKGRARHILANLKRNGWTCCQCGGPVPSHRRADASYCREGCRKEPDIP